MSERRVGEVDGIWWSEAGAGPVVLVPWLNVDWSAIDLSTLTDHLRVVVVAPRGFGPSTRPGSYTGLGIVDDLHRVLEHLGIERCATFGYSMSGVMAARMAVGDPRIVAVACGGFPLTADLTGMAERARLRNEAAQRDLESWAELVAAHDPEAVVAFWDDIGRLPRAALAAVECPVRAWWGERDTVLASLLPPEELARDLAALDVQHDVLPDLDHTEMLERLDLVLPEIASWLADQSVASDD